MEASTALPARNQFGGVVDEPIHVGVEMACAPERLSLVMRRSRGGGGVAKVKRKDWGGGLCSIGSDKGLSEDKKGNSGRKRGAKQANQM